MRNQTIYSEIIHLDETLTRHTDETSVLRVRDIDHIIWNHLELIDAYLSADIEKTVTTGQYDWTDGRSQSDLERLSDEERMRLFYLAARRAGKENYITLAQHRDRAKEALEFWRDYSQRVVAANGLHEERIQDALRVFGSPHFDPERIGWSSIGTMPESWAFSHVDWMLKGDESFTTEQVIDAFRAGNLAYKLVRNIMPVGLFEGGMSVVS
jgi:hypothetical protein